MSPGYLDSGNIVASHTHEWPVANVSHGQLAAFSMNPLCLVLRRPEQILDIWSNYAKLILVVILGLHLL